VQKFHNRAREFITVRKDKFSAAARMRYGSVKGYCQSWAGGRLFHIMHRTHVKLRWPIHVCTPWQLETSRWTRFWLECVNPVYKPEEWCRYISMDCYYPMCLSLFILDTIILFTALHGMQTRSSDENSVCLSVCPSVCPSVCLSVCHTRVLW